MIYPINSWKEFFAEIHRHADGDVTRPIHMYTLKANVDPQCIVFAVQGSPFKLLVVVEKDIDGCNAYMGYSLISKLALFAKLSHDLWAFFSSLPSPSAFVSNDAWIIPDNIPTINVSTLEVMEQL